ncbi:MAG: DNA-directed RNA polymerase subunit beta [Lentisphaeria bacterium]|nr:DNA-directed RNA polymerase subunit beta [Lentisphaeria bacterium]
MLTRKNYGELQDVLDIPDLIDIQVKSYFDFLQSDVEPEERLNKGLHEAFTEVFPIESFDQTCVVNFVSYEIGETKSSIVECLRTGKSYAVPVYVTFELENRAQNDTKIERVFIGDMPLMTPRGTFIINGAERVIISQLHRSPGICFEIAKHASGKDLYTYRIIPDRGGWMEVQFDINDYIYIYLDRRRRRRKFLISTLLRAVGYTSDFELLDAIYGVEELSLDSLRAKGQDLLDEYHLVEAVLDEDGYAVTDEKGNEIGKDMEALGDDLLDALEDADIESVKVIHVGHEDYFLNCLREDPTSTTEEALKEIYKRMRPGDPVSLPNAKSLLERLFQDPKRYDLGSVGRFMINEKFNLDVDPAERTLVNEDIVAATRYLMKLRSTNGRPDDIDHLGSRRVRTVGELVQNQFRQGLSRTERLIREKMTLIDFNEEEVTPAKLVNPKALAGVIRDFFGRSQLSQFMDQTNPLSELTNKRRLSALGPGGLNRDRAGFEVRDVHPSHYGRVCPIETPEGPNIGLISSLALYARVNELGFIETPYRKVLDCQVTDEIVYLTADQEENFVIAQANAPLDSSKKFQNKYVMCRHLGDTAEIEADKIQYIDVSPKQVVSAAAGLIPFLEHDDANRALMGSNMQRQAVPLLITDSPYVGTGLEKVVARDSRAVVVSEIDGIVAEVDAKHVVVTPDGKPADEHKADDVYSYELMKFMRSNSSTCVNQKPIVVRGDKVVKGQTLADGAATQGGELALGKNVTVAFMPWNGYNFEDAIVISERIVKEDVYTSIHISEFDITARDTKLGPEEITRDIPNVSEEALRNLGHEGIVRIGAEVKPGDIIVGKITPKSETELDPEERLLRAIFGEKAADVKDSSLVMPSGTSGIVMDVEVERKADPNAQKLSKVEIRRHIREAKNTYKAEYDELIEDLCEKLSAKLLGSKLPFDIVDANTAEEGTPIIPANRKVTKVLLRKLAQNHDNYKMPKSPTRDQIDEIMKGFRLRLRDIETRRDEIIDRYENGGDEDQGVIRSVKVYIASKRKLQVGDKMAGRHGNKGIVSTIVPEEDMPFMADGSPVDICLNPLGVPSRMNIGQVLETHLGYAAKILGFKVATPVFDGIKEETIRQLLQDAKAKKASERLDWTINEDGETVDEHGEIRRDYYLENDGKVVLYDGRTGQPFEQRVMVGEIYMLKLDHLVVSKIHARSVGPYSLVTQQPLGGKAQHGGQRFGEMEVWALEAYGAAYALQEMLTVKSDDVTGRTRIYESIVRGDNSLRADVPESFNVLMNEMKSLGLDIKPLKTQDSNQ